MKFQHTLSSVDDIITIIKDDEEMIKILQIVRDLDLPDSRIGAWFIRNKVWNHLHGYNNTIQDNDIDIVYFDTKDFSTWRATRTIYTKRTRNWKQIKRNKFQLLSVSIKSSENALF